MAIVGVIGLGQMGLGMAETLLREGFAVVGFDLDPARREMAAALGATNADSIAALCAAT
ncbi:MAG: NAD(P)-binding domain-containing protein, partial [Pseudomonadota bacterium]|nr:NAD(P)-binding domain-containing protein [Pseudomonadota bacterium]